MSDKKLNERKPSFAPRMSGHVQSLSDSSVMRDDVVKQPLVYLEKVLDTRVKGQKLEFLDIMGNILGETIVVGQIAVRILRNKEYKHTIFIPV